MKTANYFKAFGVPIGTKEYIAHWLEEKNKKIISNIREISDILDPNAIVPVEIPTRQCLWLLILTCLQFKGNYFLRHIPPQFTEMLCDQIDYEINNMIAKCFQIDFSTLSPFIQKRINLPIKLGSIGVRQLKKLRWNEYMGSIMEGIVPLLNKQSDDGFYDGKLENNHIHHWIGASALNSQDGPWYKLLAHGEQNDIGEGIRISFENIMSSFNNNLEYDADDNILNSDLFRNSTIFTGFTAQGRIQRGSITQRLTAEIEKGNKLSLMARFKTNVPTDYNNNMERLAWFNHDEISQQFPRALPNQDGIMLNNVMGAAVRNYLGLPSFILEGFADGSYFIGRNKAVVDPYGISVKNAMLLQGDYIRMHGVIQTMRMDMLRKAKVWAVREPQHMFHGLVPTDYLRRYCEEQRKTKDFIISDIVTQNHPYRQRNGRNVKK